MPFPGAAFLAGKVLNAFLLDHIDYDLDRLRRFNALITAAKAAGDEEHKRRLDEVVTRARGAPYRVVGEYMVRPSLDLGAIAGEVARAGRFKGQGGGPGIRLLRRLASARGSSEADLLSYILFDGQYAAELVRIGYEDARARHHELANFLCDCVVPGLSRAPERGYFTTRSCGRLRRAGRRRRTGSSRRWRFGLVRAAGSAGTDFSRRSRLAGRLRLAGGVSARSRLGLGPSARRRRLDVGVGVGLGPLGPRAAAGRPAPRARGSPVLPSTGRATSETSSGTSS